MTLEELDAALRRLYGEDSTANADLADTAEWFNSGLTELVADAGALQKKATFQSVRGTAEYKSGDPGFPTDLAKVRKVYYDDLELVEIDAREIGDLQTLESTPSYYYVHLYPYTLGLYPTPDAAKTVTLRYSATPAALVDPGDEPAIPAAYHRALVYFAAAQWAMADDNAGRVQMYLAMFQQRKAAFLGEGMQASDEAYPVVRYVPHV